MQRYAHLRVADARRWIAPKSRPTLQPPQADNPIVEGRFRYRPDPTVASGLRARRSTRLLELDGRARRNPTSEGVDRRGLAGSAKGL
jgi:hypothetical protein